MKSTNNSQTTEAIDKGAIALFKQDCIMKELSDEAAAKVCGGRAGGKKNTYPILYYPGVEG
jgi:hypothetical protein